MSNETALTKIAVFKGKQIRRVWDEQKEKWFFSVVDIVTVLTDSVSPLAYWRKLKERLKKEGSQTVTNCHGLKMLAADGKMRITDMADTETMFRIVQSIPSPNAEPFKLWLARVGYERVEETVDPELAIQRAMQSIPKHFRRTVKSRGRAGPWPVKPERLLRPKVTGK